eukprot:CAMPEP_0201592492 /NCGR_PEP_ID=MMETSP0190_2-20130828/190373_1 /ASSEMBLY_ACC=CAM_ASM_000263 /TAXON_ID=37353 /ORGANISM="Rosalina sp." /LENGTH=117 /DNA_ID=CAMNT_0048051289 /DNA_START=1305 /DNA_END=1655 /DNA_ORIENTATION=+
MTDQTDIRGKTAYDWAKERNMTKYVQLFQKYRNVSINNTPNIDDKDIPAKVVESIWEDHERKSMEPNDNATTPSPTSDDMNVNINISQQGETPGCSSQNGWYQSNNPAPPSSNNSNW